MEDPQSSDICRVCRSEGSPDRVLFHPCICTGSIKFIHQECLVQWLKVSKKEHCELCKHRFSFMPIYSPDMPKRLPINDIVSGLLKSVGRAVRYWLHYSLVALAWLGVVPLTACRIYRCLFTGSVTSLRTLPLDMLSRDNVLSDCFQGCFVVTCTLCAFICLVWLREQILHGGGPDWLEHDQNPNRQNGGNLAAMFGGFGGGGGDALLPAAPANHDNAGLGVIDQDAGQDIMEGEEGNNEENEVAVNDANNEGAQVADDNWNPIEWDRAAEELTWERLLGLDGSLVFLEHVFWVVSLNTLFILVFAFCPYHIGRFTIVGMKAEDMVSVTQFEGLLTTLIGYLIIAMVLVMLHLVANLVKFKRSKRLLGLCYVVVKVSLLVVTEIGLFPLICGWWLDICSLSMFDATIKDRQKSFKLAPGTSMFIHWLVGMVYVFYFASFILLLREVLRPGVLWFLRNLNDPDFNPIQEMIHLPMYRHVRRFLASMVIFGTTVLIMLWLPIRVVRVMMPTFLPYNVMLSSEAPVSELSLELLLLQVVLPALLEQGHTRQWLKNVVRAWCIAMAWMLDLRSYLLGDVPIEVETEDLAPDAGNDTEDEEAEEVPIVGEVNPDNEEADVAPAADPDPPAAVPPAPVPAPGDQPQGLGAAHQAMLQGGGPTGFQPYKHPKFFHASLLCLGVAMCVTLFVASLIACVVPVYIGRCLMTLWTGDTRIHELYTAACGLYSCWMILRISSLVLQWLPQGWQAIFARIKDWVVLVMNSFVLASLLIGLVPLLLGLLFELVVVAPLRVPLDQSPIFFPWQDWALGVLHAKIICAVTMMGPQWWLKRVVEQIYNQGLRNLDLWFVLRYLCMPVIGCLGMALAIPYIIARSFVPMMGCTFETQNLVLRRIYPFLLGIAMFIIFAALQAQQFKRLYEHIKNDKYLVGRRLVNYERQLASMLSDEARQT